MVPGKNKEQAEDSCIRELEALMKEITRAYYDLRATGQGTAPFSDWGNGSWGLLQVLATEGSMTMSALARRRSVSRQYIQKIAATPIRDKWITLEPNPADRRAPLMTITAEGRRQMRAHRRQIRKGLRGVSRHFVATDVAKAAATVSLMRSMFEKMSPAGAVDPETDRRRKRRVRQPGQE
ncbi:MAG: MarR family transcriptional regulator [Gammaproteobacteria bacterium]|nr:MarR family transcriptional regulator [Gammaproteobacteria bacterium]